MHNHHHRGPKNCGQAARLRPYLAPSWTPWKSAAMRHDLATEIFVSATIAAAPRYAESSGCRPIQLQTTRPQSRILQDSNEPPRQPLGLNSVGGWPCRYATTHSKARVAYRTNTVPKGEPNGPFTANRAMVCSPPGTALSVTTTRCGTLKP